MQLSFLLALALAGGGVAKPHAQQLDSRQTLDPAKLEPCAQLASIVAPMVAADPTGWIRLEVLLKWELC